MKTFSKKEWLLIKHACRHLWDSLDITDCEEIKERLPKVYEKNEKDKKMLSIIMSKISEDFIKE